MNFLQKLFLKQYPRFQVFAWQVMLSFFFKTIRIQNEGWFWVLKSLHQQNTGKSLPLDTLQKCLDFLTETIAGLELIMRSEVLLVLIYKLSARLCYRVNFSNDQT